MSADLILSRLRRFLLVVSGFLFAGTLVELAFINHTKDPVQFIPFGLCALGLLAVGLALVRPRRSTLVALRASMALAALGSLFGLYEHINKNVTFRLGIYPNSTGLEILRAALGGASPLLAPGVLAVAAVLALAATYFHPAMAVGAKYRVAERWEEMADKSALRPGGA